MKIPIKMISVSRKCSAGLFLLLGIMVLSACQQPQTGVIDEFLEKSFLAPPDSVRPYTWWHWVNGNVTKDGITKDLEAMKKAGVEGWILFGLGFFPPGEVTFNSETWWDHLSFSIREADRLGLKTGAFNCDGWSMSGGPWISPEESMKQLVWTEIRVEGGKTVNISLPQPLTNLFYEDITIHAFPALRNEESVKIVKIVSSAHVTDSGALVDGRAGTQAVFSPVPGQENASVVFDLGTVKEIRSMVMDSINISAWMDCETGLSYSVDGQEFKNIKNKLPIGYNYESWINSGTLSFPLVEARYFKLEVEMPVMESHVPGRIYHASASEIRFSSQPKITLWEPKSGNSKDIRHSRQRSFIQHLDMESDEKLPKDQLIPSEKIIDLKEKTDIKGILNWDAPEGSWIIQRIGYTSTNRKNHPASLEGTGLECDKMSIRATEKHFNGYLKKIIDLSKKEVGKPIDFAQMESWEAGIQNWTQGFEEEFEKRRGYSIFTYLPVITGGRVVNSYEQSDRFLWDLRKTMMELFSEYYWGTMSRLCHENGVTLLGEGSGRQHYLYHPDNYHRQVDIPMGEFWTSEPRPRASCKNASSAGHTYGKKLVAGEAFTGMGPLWHMTPYDMKPIGDMAFILGINLFVLNTFIHQPYDIPPGFTYGPFGNNFQRLNTWYVHGRAWLDYITRCQLLLRQGTSVGDICYFPGEGAPSYLGMPDEVTPALPAGYDYDGINLELLRSITVRNNKLVLPSGTQYHVLVFQYLINMTPELIREVRRIVKEGATVVAARPESSPSLSDYPSCDQNVLEVVDEVWGNMDGIAVKEHKYGKGRVTWGIPLEKMLAEMGMVPDFECHPKDLMKNIKYIHRKTGNGDIYFLHNESRFPEQVVCSFRVKDRIPEFWYADYGKTEKVPVYCETAMGTDIPFNFEAYGSVFIVFRDSKTVEHPVSVTRQAGPDKQDFTLEANKDGNLYLFPETAGSFSVRFSTGKEVDVRAPGDAIMIKLTSPWDVSFDMGRNEIKETVFEQLHDLTSSPDPVIRYFSGTVTYTNTFNIPDGAIREKTRMILDLGVVKDLATIVVNGKEAAALWKPPFRADISALAKPGLNTLQVSVTTSMLNRMIGDEQLEQDISYEMAPGGRYTIKEYPEWLANPEERPTARRTFITYKYYKKDTDLAPSGLTGPVKLLLTDPVNID